MKNKVNLSKINLSKLKVERWTEGFFLTPIVKPFDQNFDYLSSKVGRTSGIVTCPCCLNKELAYKWSFVGKGKRCSVCGVVFTIGHSATIKMETLSFEDWKILNRIANE